MIADITGNAGIADIAGTVIAIIERTPRPARP
jgi:hypothetical protein